VQRGLNLAICAFLALLATLAAAAPQAAAADPVTCQRIDPRTGLCVVSAGAGDDAPGQPGAEPAPSGGGQDPQTCFSKWTDQVVLCSSGAGIWSNTRDCYVRLLDPQPLATSPEWQGHTSGAVYTCTPDLTRVGSNLSTFFWSATPPGAPDPEQLAQEAVAAMGLSAVSIGMVPEPAAGSIGLVGMPTWMWVDRPSTATWGPVTRTASAGGVTVTATAKVEHVTWSMGDGSTVVCTSPGTAYEDRYGSQDSPDCGHRYSRTSVGLPDDAYRITATSRWVVDWAGAGDSGRIEQDLTARTAVRIGEVQVLVTS